MRGTKRLTMWLRALGAKRVVESELDEELRFHLEQQTQLYVSRGMNPADARRAALVALGKVEPTKEAQREGRGSRGIEDVIADAKYAARALWHDKPLALAGLPGSRSGRQGARFTPAAMTGRTARPEHRTK
jgi:hypothetical protein